MRPAHTAARVAAALVVTATLLAAPAAAAPRWRAPVEGAPSRLFALGPDPFARGQHRGVDFAATGAVRAACSGVVVFAGRVAGAGTVSQRCGRWRVSYAPLARIAVREGRRIGPGVTLGRVARPAAASPPGHGGASAGLHFGVRREGERFGYVDPLRFLAARLGPSPPLVGRPAGRRPGAPAPRSEPVAPARRVAPSARPVAARAHAPPPLAPWPVWAGLAMMLTGLAGAGRLTLPVRNRRLARAARRPFRAPLR
jgi:hypothetical protein